MSDEVNESMISHALEWVYESVNLDSAEELANGYLRESGSWEDKVNSLIRWQIAKASASGFISGLGGLLTLPVAIPANISIVLYVQIRMIVTIAIMGGHDVKKDQVQTLVYLCLCGNGAKEALKQVGIQVGTKLTQQAIKGLSFEIIKQINQAVGFRLVTKFGEKGVINLGKVVPFVGGVIGGTFDAVSTNAIGNVARDIFAPEENSSNSR